MSLLNKQEAVSLILRVSSPRSHHHVGCSCFRILLLRILQLLRTMKILTWSSISLILLLLEQLFSVVLALSFCQTIVRLGEPSTREVRNFLCANGLSRSDKFTLVVRQGTEKSSLDLLTLLNSEFVVIYDNLVLNIITTFASRLKTVVGGLVELILR